ncbi:MAG: hypothetical protein MJ092_05770 [Lachnospiraceae bacterium]|nr:hypothetical protein [Lachnospiraceae bacterium]
MTEILKKTSNENIYKKVRRADLHLQEEIRRNRELLNLLNNYDEAYYLASCSRIALGEPSGRNNGQIRQMDQRLEQAEQFQRSVLLALQDSCAELLNLTDDRIRLELCVLYLNERERKLFRDFVNERPIKEMVEELNLSERTIKRKKQEIAQRIELLFYSDRSLHELLTK